MKENNFKKDKNLKNIFSIKKIIIIKMYLKQFQNNTLRKIFKWNVL